MGFQSGNRIGSYEILGRLGAGGMGEVFRARDTQLGRTVAIKVLHQEAAANQARLRRFIAEAKAASALNHPNILTVYAMGEDNQRPYIVTEYVDGSTLRALLADNPLSLPRVLEIASQILSGLAKAHSAGIVHRDLKPENLMITRDGYVKILDFGLAKLLKTEESDSNGQFPAIETFGMSATDTGTIMGTAGYMSPEQARGQHADMRSDVFSMGVVFYEMLTGTNPFRRQTAVDTISAILRDPAPSLTQATRPVPAELSEIVEKALQKNPEDRYASAREMETAFHAVKQKIQSAWMVTLDSGDLKAAVQATRAAFTITSGLPKNRKTIYLASGILLILTLFAFLRAMQQERKENGAMGPPVIAVMAIENKTHDADLKNADIGRILSDAFVQILYDTQGIQVVSPVRIHSVVSMKNRSFQETARDPEFAQDVGRQSEANIILSGSLSQVGGTFILNVVLTDLSTQELVGTFSAQSQDKTNLLPSLTDPIAVSLKEKISHLSGATIAGGSDLHQVATGSFDAYAHFVRGMDLTSEGRWKEAIVELQKAAEIDPNMGMAWVELACAYSFAGDEIRSQAALSKAKELRSRMSRKDQLWLDSASIWLTGNAETYRQAMEKYIKEYPDDRNGYFYLGMGEQWLAGDYHKALFHYEKAYRLTPDYFPLTKVIVDCYLGLNEKPKAMEVLRRYLKVVKKGYAHERAKQWLQKLEAA